MDAMYDVEPPSITCPVCQWTSYHPKDIEYRYCGNCHQFHDLLNGSVDADALTIEVRNTRVDLLAQGFTDREITGEAIKALRVESESS